MTYTIKKNETGIFVFIFKAFKTDRTYFVAFLTDTCVTSVSHASHANIQVAAKTFTTFLSTPQKPAIKMKGQFLLTHRSYTIKVILQTI